MERAGVSESEAFTAFVADTRRRLWSAVVPIAGPVAADDAVAEALTWAWEHWEDLQQMENPAGYLYRIAQRHASRRSPHDQLPEPPPQSLPEVEPALVPALSRLSEQQRSVVWLVDGCGWGLTEVSRMLDISVSSIRTHRSRALERLRSELEVDVDAEC